MDDSFYELICQSLAGCSDQQIKTIYVTARQEVVRRKLRAGPSDIWTDRYEEPPVDDGTPKPWPVSSAPESMTEVKDQEEPLLTGVYPVPR